MDFFNKINYVYKVEMLAILGIVLLLLYVFWALKIFEKKE